MEAKKGTINRIIYYIAEELVFDFIKRILSNEKLTPATSKNEIQLMQNRHIQIWISSGSFIDTPHRLNNENRRLDDDE
jgi:hypothetical protein